MLVAGRDKTLLKENVSKTIPFEGPQPSSLREQLAVGRDT